MVDKYIPRQKNIVFFDFNPTVGHKQRGYRPALVVSNDVEDAYYIKNKINELLQ